MFPYMEWPNQDWELHIAQLGVNSSLPTVRAVHCQQRYLVLNVAVWNSAGREVDAREYTETMSPLQI